MITERDVEWTCRACLDFENCLLKHICDDKTCRSFVFSADGKWYAREGYEKFGAHVSPYNNGEIEFDRNN